MPRHIAVTGATGFIGKALCGRLRADGYSVRALVRNPARVDPGLDGIELHQGDITQPSSLQGFLTNIDAVIHCAGSVRGASQSQFDQVNVDGLRHLIAEINAQAHKPRLLSLSSLAAREPALSFYATSKSRGELLLRETGQTFEWAAFRPPPVYGPGDKELLPLLKMMAQGFALIPGSLHARFSMIYIDDLVSAITCWLDSTETPTGIFTLEDGTPDGYDWSAITSTISALSGRRVRRLPVPGKMLDMIAWLNRACARLIGYAPMLTPEKLRELRHENWVCDSQALTEKLGWTAHIRLQDGLKKTIFSQP